MAVEEPPGLPSEQLWFGTALAQAGGPYTGVSPFPRKNRAALKSHSVPHTAISHSIKVKEASPTF